MCGKFELGLPCCSRQRNNSEGVFIVQRPTENKSLASSDHFCDSFQVFSCFIRECCAISAIVYAHGNHSSRASHEFNASPDWTVERQCLRFLDLPAVFIRKILDTGIATWCKENVGAVSICVVTTATIATSEGKFFKFCGNFFHCSDSKIKVKIKMENGF